ncbi:MAG: HAD family hydrolase [Planctomycetota bacterium]|nr:MAG: HAD family hydrolase [Planctomycetota bacterium]
MRFVCLFDIDGTLLSTGGAGQRAMERALTDVFGIPNPNEDIPAAGRTDRAITHDLFAHHGLTPAPHDWEQFQQVYFGHLKTTMHQLSGVVLPGVVTLLEELAARDDVSLGLLTGNFREAARIKLAHHTIDHHFAYGGYGDHHHDRDDVARVAFDEACRHLGRPVNRRSVCVIGDTPSDVKCARAIGAQAVAVATGMFTREELARCQPDELYTDFADTRPFLELVAC